MRSKLFTLCVVALGAAASSAADEPAASADTSITAGFDTTIRFDSDFDDAPGSIGLASYVMRARLEQRVTDDLSLGFAVSGRIDDYDLDNTAIAPDDPEAFDDVYGITFSADARWQIDDHWTLIAGGLVRLSYEDDADAGDSLTGGGFATLAYSFSKDLTIGGGFFVTSRLEDDALIVPTAFVRWQINEKLSFTTEGLSGTLGYQVNDDLTAFFRGGYWRNEFLLEDNGGTLSDGVVRDRHVRLAVGVDFTPASMPGLTVEALVGATVAGELEVLDSSGAERFERDIDPAPFFGVRARYRF